MIIEITWWFGTTQLRDSNEIRIITEENKSSCEILNVTENTVGYYSCKATNEIGMNISRAKFSLAAAKAVIETVDIASEAVSKKVGKKRMTKKAAQKAAKLHKSTVEIRPKQEEVTIEIVSDDKKTKKTKKPPKPKIIPVVSVENKVLRVEVIRMVEEIHLKIIEKTITKSDIIEISQHEDVTTILETIDTEIFKAGEKSLRDLATISVLLTYGLEISEITYLYEANIFPTLKDPETQAALVQLVEREGHEELIAQILAEQASEEDETSVAATIGFRAFIKMIEISNITIEEVITKFVKEDFIAQEWKYTKEVVITLKVLGAFNRYCMSVTK